MQKIQNQGIFMKKNEKIIDDNKLKINKEKQEKLKKIKAKQKYNNDKNKYFAFYDDIKHSSHDVIDW